MRNSGISNRCNPILAAIISLSMAYQMISAEGTCPCDIYASGGTQCVAAHSTVRALYGSYNGPLYQVRRKSDNKTLDIGVLKPGGVANSAAQDSFLSGTTGTISIIYDQSPKGNNLTVAPLGQRGTADVEANATALTLKVGGHAVYAVYVNAGVGYRNDKTSGVATGDQPEGLYMVTSGKHVNSGCCFDYGNAETNNRDNGNGTMEAIYMGTCSNWGHGSGSGPWVMADLENGLYAGGALVNNNNTSVPYDYVTAIVKGKAGGFSIKGGNAQNGNLTTMYDGARPTKSGYDPMKKEGAIILGTGGDNSNSAIGTFFEGAMTSGYPSDTTENAVQANIVAAGYGSNNTIISYRSNNTAPGFPFRARYNSSRGDVVVGYSLQNGPRRMSMNIIDLSGRRIATIVNGIVSAGPHEAVWDTRRIPAGIYACRIAIDGWDEWAGKIIIGK
jgi:non-reducing end alpha-L-arabinofuranosidase